MMAEATQAAPFVDRTGQALNSRQVALGGTGSSIRSCWSQYMLPVRGASRVGHLVLLETV